MAGLQGRALAPLVLTIRVLKMWIIQVVLLNFLRNSENPSFSEIPENPSRNSEIPYLIQLGAMAAVNYWDWDRNNNVKTGKHLKQLTALIASLSYSPSLWKWCWEKFPSSALVLLSGPSFQRCSFTLPFLTQIFWFHALFTLLSMSGDLTLCHCLCCPSWPRTLDQACPLTSSPFWLWRWRLPHGLGFLIMLAWNLTTVISTSPPWLSSILPTPPDPIGLS